MLRNYLKIAARHLWHQRGFTAMNVVGLAVGMATCLLVGLYIQDELSYDTFHPQSDRILAVTIENDFFDQRRRITPLPLGELLRTEVPGVQHVTRTKGTSNEQTVRYADGDQPLARDQRVLKSDASFFDVFSGFRMRQSSDKRPLNAPDEAVITTSMARTFFGDQNPIGKTLSVEDDSTRRYTVVGITEVPENSSVQFDMVVPMPDVESGQQWGMFMYHTYARSEANVSPAQVEEAVQTAVPSNAENYVGAVGTLPLPELYLSEVHDAGGFKGQARYLYIFGTIALLILLIAAFNYVNLVTAQAEKRIREIGVRKAMGASRTQVAYQFLGEAVLLSGIALLVAVGLVVGVLPVFNALFEKSLSLTTVRHGWALLNGIGVVGSVGILAGAYPAFVLSGFAPTRILRGASTTTTGRGGWLRKGLVVTQFATSAGLILGTIVIYQQLDYVQTKHLGFEGEQVVTVDLGDVPESRHATLRREVQQHPDVAQTTISTAVPGGFGITFSNEPKNLSPEAQTTREKIEVHPATVDTSYVKALGLRLIAGQDFATRPSDGTGQGYIFNEAAVKALGWTPDAAVGKPFTLAQADDAPMGQVIGVVENFHLESLRSPITPVVLMQEAEDFSSSSTLAARLAPGGISNAMEHLRAVVQEVAPTTAFQYTFLDDTFAQMYRAEQRLARIFAVFALIAVVVACMGLFALAAYSVRRRTQEIGVRKALGATAASIVGLLSREYATLLGGAFAVGTPVAYVGMQRWLQDFAYRVDLGVAPFLWTAVLAVGIAGLSVGIHAFRAARTDPATALRDE